MLNDFLKAYGISWNKICSICVDDASSMLGHKSDFVNLVKEVVPDVATIHCAIHRQALASKTLRESLKKVLSAVVQIADYIGGKVLQHRLLKALCQ